MITRSASAPLDSTFVQSVVGEFNREVLPRFEMLRKYYDGKSGITQRVRSNGLPNNKLAHAFPRYITTMASGYLAGQPVRYNVGEYGDETALDVLEHYYKVSNIDSVDSELAKDASIYGKGVCICYMSGGEKPRPMATTIDPRTAFVVYDDTVEHNPIYGVHMYKRYAQSGEKPVQIVDVYSKDARITFAGETSAGAMREEETQTHYFGGVPIVEFWNNADETGDFEPVIPLIDAYDVIESDRVNDKQQFSDAILLLTGCVLDADGEHDENGELIDKRSPAQKLLEDKTLSLPDTDAKAEWLIKDSDEAGDEVLRNAIKTDIHKMSMVPDLTDENFAANASGVAMRYKLLGFENLTVTKERWFREGLRARLKLFANMIAIAESKHIDADSVQISMVRALPVNETEIASMVATLDGLVPRKTLLAQVPFVSDPDEAEQLLIAEKKEDIELQRETFAPEYPDANKRPPVLNDDNEADEDKDK